ncbi:MAG: dihydroxy-acid dehydratase [Candidatus Atribacteria bacterium]|nr:dihydroxy-acid dehydratase [Candidatus Atribacteria bacterium]
MIKSKPRSSKLEFGVTSEARKTLLMGSGYSKEELSKPMVGIIVQESQTIHPGHTNLSELAKEVKKGVYESGGLPVVIDVGGFCDGIMMANPKYIFVQRNVIVNMIEIAAEANLLDALVLLASCDKNVPAALMSAGRINIPSIVLLGGIMPAGTFKNKKVTVEDVFHSVGKVKNGKMSESDFEELVENACTNGGACCCMTTGTTMQIITEALGMSLPNNSSSPGNSMHIRKIARNAGHAIINLLEQNIRPRDIINKDSIMNAIKVCLAIGGSMHAFIHMPAIAIEAGLKMNVWDYFDEYSRIIPTLVGIAPNGDHNMEDYDRAGGTPVIMKEIKEFLNQDVITVNGIPIKTYFEDTLNQDRKIIHSIDSPWREDGGLAILKGNIAEEGSVLRLSGVPKQFLTKVFKGEAKVFISEDKALKYLKTIDTKDIIDKRFVLVVKNQGLSGYPGINTLLPLTGEITGMDLEEKIAVLTDGNFSGGTRGMCVGLVSPESAMGGNLALIKDNDVLEIDIANRKICMELDDLEFLKRKKEIKNPVIETNSPCLYSFSKLVRPISEGGVENDLDRGKYKTLS